MPSIRRRAQPIPKGMKVIFFSILGLAMVFALAAGGSSPTSKPGSPVVYTDIATKTDCAALQADFDTAERNGDAARARHRLDLAKGSTSYMQAIDARMRAIGCY